MIAVCIVVSLSSVQEKLVAEAAEKARLRGDCPMGNCSRQGQLALVIWVPSEKVRRNVCNPDIPCIILCTACTRLYLGPQAQCSLPASQLQGSAFADMEHSVHTRPKYTLHRHS